MANQWLRLYHEFATDPKIQMLSESDQRRYIMILCMRCSNGDVTLHDNEVAFQLRVTDDEWIATKERLISKNLITSDNKPVAWDKRQYASDSSAERVRRFRENKKQACNVTVTPPDTDTDTDTDTDIKKKNKRKKTTTAKQKILINPDWKPSERCMELIEETGIDKSFATSLIKEFIFYWEQQGEKRPGWDTTFLNHAKKKWGYEKNEKNQQYNQSSENQKLQHANQKAFERAQQLEREIAEEENRGGICEVVGIASNALPASEIC